MRYVNRSSPLFFPNQVGLVLYTQKNVLDMNLPFIIVISSYLRPLSIKPVSGPQNQGTYEEPKEKWMLSFWPYLLYSYHLRTIDFFFSFIQRSRVQHNYLPLPWLMCTEGHRSPHAHVHCPWRRSFVNAKGSIVCSGCAGTTGAHAITKDLTVKMSYPFFWTEHVYVWYLSPRTPWDVCKSDNIFHLTDKKAKSQS